MPKASLIISVYKKIHELELILSALTIQSNKNFEVLIADDGSGDNMNKYIKAFQKTSNLAIKHVYQDDIGFRKNKILNSAILQSKTDYIIFIDGDCIPHSSFVNEHITNKKPNTVLCGRRVNLSKRLSEKINKEIILTKEYEKIKFSHFLDSWRDKKIRSTFIEEGLVFKNKSLRKFLSKGAPHIVGCNFSLNKKMMVKINGFDENYIGAGIGEDSDIEFRLRLAGVDFKSIRNLAVLFHLYHNSTAEVKQNYDYFTSVQKRNAFACKNGLVRLP